MPTGMMDSKQSKKGRRRSCVYEMKARRAGDRYRRYLFFKILRHFLLEGGGKAVARVSLDSNFYYISFMQNHSFGIENYLQARSLTGRRDGCQGIHQNTTTVKAAFLSVANSLRGRRPPLKKQSLKNDTATCFCPSQRNYTTKVMTVKRPGEAHK